MEHTTIRENRLSEVLNAYRNHPGSLLPVLQQAQKIYGYITIEAQRSISSGLGIPLAEVAGTLSFYRYFAQKKQGGYVIRVCRSAPCHVNAAGATLRAFEDALGICAGETTTCGRFMLEVCECLGMCERSPAVMVNGEVHGPVRAEDAAALVAYLKQGAQHE